MSKRLLLLTIGILMLFALSALATETRVATMGNSGLYLKDDAGMFFYPGTMGMYQKLIVAEHQGSSFSNRTPFAYHSQSRVGIVMPAWGNGTLAIFAGEGSENFNFGGVFPGPGFDAPVTRFLVGYGFNTGNSSLGFQVDFSGVRDESGITPPQGGTPQIFTANTWGFAVGLSTPMGDLNNLDFGFRVRIGSFEEKNDSSADVLTNKSDGNMALSFVVRDYYALNDYLNLVPVGALGIASEKNIDYDFPVGPDSILYKFNTTAIEAGLALQTKPTENSEIIGGAGYRYAKLRTRTFGDASEGDTLNTDFSESETHLPFAFLGFEAQVKNWMHFRIGAEKAIETFKEKSDKPVFATDERNEFKESNSPFSYAVGVGIHAGPVTMDAQVSNSWWNMGPNFLSGNDLGGDMFPMVSFTYWWK